MAGSGNVPAFTGGALVDGTYHLTTAISYGSTGAVGQKQRVTIAITSGSFSLVQDSDASCNSAPSGKGTYATAGNQWTLTFACPAAGSQTTAYTATPTGFSIGDSTQPSGVVFNYTRQ